MKVAILTAGRFHVLDLARELSALGHDVQFYSYVPHNRALKFGLPISCCRSLFFYAAPFLLLRIIAPKKYKSTLDHLLHRVLDTVVQWRIEPCDVVIAMSGIYVKSLLYAKQRYGAKIYLERGSKHIISQKEILDRGAFSGYKVDKVPVWAVKRELAGYDLADKIVVPSMHVERSFIEQGIPVNKLFRNLYGVDLTMFGKSQSLRHVEFPTIIFVGNWSYQKGVDVLVAAWRSLGTGVRLIHVGQVGDMPMPIDKNFEHVDPVPQWRLSEYYSRAHVFVLASRQEGLALVQLQALACGLPLVCSDQTGGEDLQRYIADSTNIKVVGVDDFKALSFAMEALLSKSLLIQQPRDLLGEVGRKNLTWSAYGLRYANELRNEVGNKLIGANV